MEWREADGVEWLEAFLPGARVAFSTRSAGDLKESHERLAGALGLDPSRIVMGRQVHGAEIAFHEGPAETVTEADGHYTDTADLPLMVFAADCLPVALASPDSVAIVHCGWRGLAAAIAYRGAGSIGATDAVIGPGIGPCCYEVGIEVRRQFLGADAVEGGVLDLAEEARSQLRAAGVERIESADLCTSCNPELFFSYRREGEQAGRQGGLVWMEAATGACM